MQLLKLRYLQLKRDLSYWVPIFFAGVFFIAHEISGVSQQYCLGLGICTLFILYAYHINRKDLKFITTYFNHPKRDLWINYNVLVLPVSAAMASNSYWLIAFALQVSVILILFSSKKGRVPDLFFIAKLIPKTQFEWISGVRRNFYVIVPLLLIAVFLSPVKFFGPVSLFLLNTIFLSFYNSFEPLAMLNPEHSDTDFFLKKKVVFFSKVLLIFSLPLLLINSIFQPDVAWFNLTLLLGFLLLASCAVYIKYAYYKPNDEIHFHIDFLFLFAAALIPFLLPIAFFLNASHKKKALQNLSNYMDDNS